MARDKGSKNKKKIVEVFTLTPDRRLNLIAALLVEIIAEEQK